MAQEIPPLHGRDLLVLFLQLTLLLASARLLGEWMRRLRQPAVIGELLAGIVLGPTLLGHYIPEVYGVLFPQSPLAYHLLEAIAWVGLALLLLLTGLEVDVSRLRRIGRPALTVSAVDLAVCFAAGAWLGWLLPDAWLVDPGRRGLFAAFMAVAVGISAMPVIAKILMDLKLLHRNLGILSLSAAVVEDTVGWLVLSVLAGLAAETGFRAHRLGLTLLALAGFVIVGIVVVPPILRRIYRWVDDHFHGTGVDLTLVVVFTFFTAAITEWIGVHAVFGAFVAGVVLRQVPRLRHDSLHTLEQFVMAVLAPIFFAYVGLRVDLWTLTGWTVPLVVLGVSILAKLVGCAAGGRLGGLRGWEPIAVGAALSARGAMGLVVAILGLTLGVLTEEVYSILVGVAVITSALTPALLPFAVARIPLTEEERRRREAGELKRVFRKDGQKLLLPTAGGPHAEAAFRVAAPLAAAPGSSLTVLYVEAGARRPDPLRRLWQRIRGPGAPLTPIEEHVRHLRTLSQALRTTFDWRTVRGPRVSDAILAEAARGYDLILLGAPGSAELQDPALSRLLTRAPCHVVVVRASAAPRDEPYRHVLVPTDGSFFARAALEFSVNLAESTGGHVAVFTVLPESDGAPAPGPAAERRRIREVVKGALLGPTLKPVTALADAPVEVRIARSDRPGEAIVGEALSSDYDLIVLGAENKSLARPLFYGQGTEYVLRHAPCDVAVVVPRL